MAMKNALIIFIISGLFIPLKRAENQQLQSFSLAEVRLLEGPFQRAQQADMKYMLALNPDRLLAPFLIDAGIEPKAPRYGSWESLGLDGHTAGHYLSALSFMYASTGKEELIKRLDYMIDWLARCQEKNSNGYVAGIPDGKSLWNDIAAGKINVGSFSLENRWVPLYNIHKLFAGLRDAYLVAGNRQALDVLIKLTDWFYDLTRNLTDEQIQTMLRSEHGGLNEVFADVSVITGDQKYLTLAKRFSHRLILDPLIEGKDELTGLHANTQIPKVVGFERIAELTGNEEWANAARFFWSRVVDNRSVSIGGNSVREHFNPVNDFSSMIESVQGPESCNTYNMLKLTRFLFLADQECKYMDYYERALFNHILSSEEPDKGGFVYFTPMRPRHYRVYSQPQQCFWCCVGTGMENHGKYGLMIYSHNEKDVFVNLFIPSVLKWEEKGITITQQTKFPFQDNTEIKLKMLVAQAFKLKIRYPAWVRQGEMKISVNGQPFRFSEDPSSYVSIDRKWKSGDVVSVTMPMHTHIEYLPDSSSWASIEYGPVVLAAITDTTDLNGLYADDSRMGHVANGPLYPLEDDPVIVSEDKDFVAGVHPVNGKPLTFTMPDLIYPEKYRNLELVPFSGIHEARYMIYWLVMTADSLESRNKALREKEDQLLAIESMTVDQVAPGEQQPEAEHNFKGENTESGVFQGKHWRHAKGWFSYDLNNTGREGCILRVTYYGLDRGRNFDILVNDQVIATVKLDGSHGNAFFEKEYTIPQDILDGNQNDVLNVKFKAHKGSVAGGIYYLRLIK